jgi:hypothetical protein
LVGVPVLALLVGVALGVASTAVSSRDQEVQTVTKTVTVTATPQEPTATGPTAFFTGSTGTTAATGPTGSTGGSTLAEPFALGVDASAYGWTIKVTDFNPSGTEAVKQANQFNDPPRKGTYAIVNVRFSRESGGGSDPWWDIQASLVVNGETYAEADGACCLPDAWDEIGNVPVGGSAVGQMAFDVPTEGLEDAILYLIITDPRSFDEAEGFFAVT